MKAAWYTDQGAPAAVFTVGDLPEPSPGPGEVKVRVHASGVNPTDTYTRDFGTPSPTASMTPAPSWCGTMRGKGMPRRRVPPRV